MIMNAIPQALKHAITMGIGMFVALLGLVKAGFVGRGEGGPLTQLVPAQVASAALVVIGAMMMSAAAHVDWSDRATSVPVFLTVALMPFTYDITAGVGAGVISCTVIRAAQGRWREVGASCGR